MSDIFKKNSIVSLAVLLALMFTLALFMFNHADKANASAAPLQATQSIATTTAIGPQQVIQIFAARQGCTSRVFSTATSAVMVIFDDPTNGDVASTSFSINKGVGFWFAASTTVTLDSGIYGCGRMFASAVSSSTITSAELR